MSTVRVTLDLPEDLKDSLDASAFFHRRDLSEEIISRLLETRAADEEMVRRALNGQFSHRKQLRVVS